LCRLPTPKYNRPPDNVMTSSPLSSFQGQPRWAPRSTRPAARPQCGFHLVRRVYPASVVSHQCPSSPSPRLPPRCAALRRVAGSEPNLSWFRWLRVQLPPVRRARSRSPPPRPLLYSAILGVSMRKRVRIPPPRRVFLEEVAAVSTISPRTAGERGFPIATIQAQSSSNGRDLRQHRRARRDDRRVAPQGSA